MCQLSVRVLICPLQRIISLAGAYDVASVPDWAHFHRVNLSQSSRNRRASRRRQAGRYAR